MVSVDQRGKVAFGNMGNLGGKIWRSLERLWRG